MPIKTFGPNRMLAQQPEHVEPGNEHLVKNRPTIGLGPEGMPGSAGYDPTPRKGFRGRERAPNAYERGGFYWTGSRVAQGTPLATLQQDRRSKASEDARRWAETAIQDRTQGVRAKDVNARIRQADRGLNQKGQGLDLRAQELGLKRRQGAEKLRQDRMRLGLNAADYRLRRRVADDRADLAMLQEQRAGEKLKYDKARRGTQAALQRLDVNQGDRYTPESLRKYAQSGDPAHLDVASVTAGREWEFLPYYAQATGETQPGGFVGPSGEFTSQASMFLGLVDALARMPAMQRATPDQLAVEAVRQIKNGLNVPLGRGLEMGGGVARGGALETPTPLRGGGGNMGVRRAPDGRDYVRQNGRFYRVDRN